MPESLKNYCTRCMQQTSHSILFKKNVSDKGEADWNWDIDYYVVQCMGCETVCFRTEYSDESTFNYDENGDTSNSPEIANYPLYLRNHRYLLYSFQLPPRIRTVYLETIEALKVKSYLLAGVGFRAIIEAICMEQDIKGRDLKQQIRNLLKSNAITLKEEKRLHSIRFLGNDSIHEMTVPSESKLLIVLEIVEHLLKNLYLIDYSSNRHLDLVIDEFEDFAKLLLIKTKELENGDEKNLKQIIGKDIRRLPDDITHFEKALIADITSEKIKYLSLGKSIQNKSSKLITQYYVKIELPETDDFEDPF